MKKWCKALKIWFYDPSDKSLTIQKKIQYITDDACQQQESVTYI